MPPPQQRSRRRSVDYFQEKGSIYMSTNNTAVVNKRLLDCLLALPGRIGTQPQRDVFGLHSLPYHTR